MKGSRRSDLVFSDEHGVADLFDTHVVPDIAGRFGDGPVNQAVEFVEEGDHAIHHVNHVRLRRIVHLDHLLDVLVLRGIARKSHHRIARTLDESAAPRR